MTKTIDQLKKALGKAKTTLIAAQERTKRQVDTSRRSETFAVGDEVVVTTKYLRTYAPHLPMKLKRQWIGPFRITRVINPVTYTVGLPPQWDVHPSFHISKLKRYHRSEEFL